MIPVFRPSVGIEEMNAIREVLESGWIGLGPKTQEFEREFAKYVCAKYAIALNSGTAALHLALKIFGVTSGEVIVPSLTFISTTHAVVYNNSKPVFADVEEDTLCMSVEDLQKKITDNTKAIIPVHYGGHPCDMDAILEIAEDHNLAVIEDAAHACGAEYKGKKIGSIGDATCFSFHAVKNLTTGEGGMITTDKDVADRLKKLRWLGISKGTFDRSSVKSKYSWYYDVEELGFKYHMNDIPAAIGLVQLQKLDMLNNKRREITNRYNKNFRDLEWLQTPVVKSYAKSAHHNYVVKAENRDKLIEHMENNGIACGVHYMPNHLHPLYKKIEAKVPVTERVWKKLVTLPLYPDMSDMEVERVTDWVKSFTP